MLKKIFFIILSLNLLNHCDYSPVYSKQNKVNYKIVETENKEFLENYLSANKLKKVFDQCLNE